MTDQDYKELNRLLSKLGQEFKGGSYRWLIFPNYMQDCPHMAMFSYEGERLASFTKPTLKECVDRINEELSVSKEETI